ncbi:piezo-type mechanosensitive ion channel component 2-like [Mobula birostris]|uniref:piezo-type mechanosensitive ion channel component 2-like n=1 Tax=Mobula birostris TaxID=1983395 RepID=UPI003B280F5B
MDSGDQDHAWDVDQSGSEEEVYGTESEEETCSDSQSTENEEDDDEEEEEETLAEDKEGNKQRFTQRLALLMMGMKELIGDLVTTAGKAVVTVLLGFAGIVHPSVLSAVYFFTFLGLGSWWACARFYGLFFFRHLCLLMLFFSGGHLVLIYIYQLPLFQGLLPPNNFWMRLFGLTAVIHNDLSEPWQLMTHPGLHWPVLLNPIALLILYFTVATITRHLLLSEESGAGCPRMELSSVQKQTDNVGAEASLQVVDGENKEQELTDVEWQQWERVQDQTADGIHYNTRLVKHDGTLAELIKLYEDKLKSETPTRVCQEMEMSEDDMGKPSSSFSVIGHMVMQQSYTCALIFMMVWSITYNSWLTFALLIWSCVIWMVRDRQRWTKLSSPVLVIYGNLLVTQQFFVGLQLTEDELFPGVSDNILIDFDLKKSNTPCVHLAAKIFYTLMFWLLLRQHLIEKEKMSKRTQGSLSEVRVQGTEGTQEDVTLMTMVGSVVKGLLIKYWICFCTAMFFIVSFNGRVVVYKILYIKLFLFSVALYQIHYDWWRRILRYFWIAVVSYSMAVLIAIYIYQFKTVSWLFQRTMGMSEDSLKDLGLEQYDTAELFASILLPSAFLLACILQLHYFHNPFLSLTDLRHVSPSQDNIICRLNDEHSESIRNRSDTLEKLNLEEKNLRLEVEVEPDNKGFYSLNTMAGTELRSGKTLPEPQQAEKSEEVFTSEKMFSLMEPMNVKIGTLDTKMDKLTKANELFEKTTIAIQESLKSLEDRYQTLKQSTHRAERDFELMDQSIKEQDLKMSFMEKKINENTLELSRIKKKVIDLESRNYRTNLRILGLPENTQTASPCPWSMVIDRLTTLFLKFLELVNKAQVLVWRLLELHIIKIVSSFIIWITLREVSLMNYVFLILWVFALPYSSFRPLASSISTLWACVMIICKMMYQLKVVKISKYSRNCTLNGSQELQSTSALYAGPIDPVSWYGALRKCEDDVLPCLQSHLIILGLLAFEVTVYRHQQYYRLQKGLKTPLTGTLLDNITRLHLDDGLWNCIKYFINYFFYKFGLEVCFMMAINLVGQRMDLYSAIHALCLTAIVQRRRRKAIAEIWPKYCCFIACIISFQYLLCLGIPPSFCKDYPWRSSLGLSSNLIKWLYLPDFIRRPNPMFLVYDFMLLLYASNQWQVFEDENKGAVRLLAGENTEIGRSLDTATVSQYIPVANFLHCRCYLDMLKVVVFSYLFWFVLCLIFITGTSRINIFCMGYLVACFYFLLSGGQLLLKPVRVIVDHWDYLIGYTILVIVTKNIFSIGSCVYLKSLLEGNCWVVQTFGMACTITEYDLPNTDNLHEACEVPSKQAGIIWDSVCFLFLLAQRRVFLSYYFLHVVADLKASKLLAARGAELFEAKVKKGITMRLEKERRSMEMLKKQMERIKAKQEKYKKSVPRSVNNSHRVGNSKSDEDHDSDEERADNKKDKGSQKNWWQPWVTHNSMIHSGSYYLFDTDSEDETKEENEIAKDETQKSSAFQFAYIALVKDSKAAVKGRHKELKQVKRAQRKKERTQQDVSRFDSSEDDLDLLSTEELDSQHPDNLIRRGVNIATFTWMFIQALVDGLIELLNTISKDNIDISTVLRIERSILRRELKQGKVPDQDSIHRFYNAKLKNQASCSSDRDWTQNRTMERGRTAASGFRKLASINSMLSRDSSVSSCNTEVTTLGSRQPTCDNVDETEEPITEVPRPSSYSRRTLQKMPQIDMSLDSEILSAPAQSVLLHSQQGTIEEEEGEDIAEGCITLCSHKSDIPPGYNTVVGSLSEENLYSEPEEQKLKTGQGTLDYQSRLLTASDLMLNKMFHDTELEESDKFYSNLPCLLKLLFALYNTMMSQSDMLCYFVIILNHMVSASLLTLVLPILVFLWAMLSMPRPKKRFWMFAILYTEITVVVKYCFQFGFFPWTTSSYRLLYFNQPFYLPNIIGIEKKDGYVHYDLIQLLALFLHRSVLKRHGLWDSHDAQKEQKQGKGEAKEENSYTESTEDMARATGRKGISRRLSRRLDRGDRTKISKRSKKKRQQPKSRSGLRETIKEWIREKGRRVKRYIITLLSLCRALQIFLPMKQFFYNIIHPEYNAVCDVYALMFLIDVINFIIIVFGYWAFGKHTAVADITESISEDHVPHVFLVMVLVQFASMVVDRALYLRKTVLGKVVFQVVLVLGIHFWMFFILPGITERRFNQNQIAQLWYFVKCIYLGLSAYQIKCGYPNRVLGNFLTKSYNYFNLFLFQGFRLVPFLMELRAVMDWVWTDTTLSISSWICVEDIYANIFILKCWNESEKRYPQAVGQKKNMLVKYGMGGLIITLLICIVWFPLLFMSLVKSVGGVTSQPLDVSIKISFGGYEPLFTMSAQQQNLSPFSTAAYNRLSSQYALYPSAMQFLVNYKPEDIMIAHMKSDAHLLWSISPASLRAMKEELINSSQVYIHLHWTILRNASLMLNPETFGEHTVLCTDKEVRKKLLQLLEGSHKKPVVIQGLLPKYIRATHKTEAKPAYRLRLGTRASRNNQDNLAFYRNLSLHLEEEPGQGNTSYTKVKWWKIKEWSPHCASQGCSNMQLIIFNDKVSPSSLGFLAGYGIVGLYMSVVLVIGKFVREFFNGISRSIMFEELPNPDRILKLCTDIFLVREMGELELEEQLFAKLIFLYRSPETMIKWTREKQH